jgi:hypothetical protein
MSGPDPRSRTASLTTLEQAASTIFALTALLPFLIFVWIVYALGAILDLRAQVALVLSLTVSVLGFVVLRIMMRRTSSVLHLLVRDATPERTRKTIPDAVTAGADLPPPPPSPRIARAERSLPEVDVAPAVGSIRELRDAAEAVMRRAKREAERLVNRPVLVAVINADRPEAGMLTRVTDVGLVLEQEGLEFGVVWRLVASVELDPRVGEPVPAEPAV